MKDGKWTAVTTLGTMEYVVHSELNRAGLSPYLAQRKASWAPRGATRPMTRKIPIFPKYVFLPVAEARLPQVHYCRGLPSQKYLLTSAEGAIWTMGSAIVDEIMRLEREGTFDEVPPELGDRVRLKGGGALSTMELLVASLDTATAQILTPLFGGTRATVKTADLARAT